MRISASIVIQGTSWIPGISVRSARLITAEFARIPSVCPSVNGATLGFTPAQRILAMSALPRTASNARATRISQSVLTVTKAIS